MVSRQVDIDHIRFEYCKSWGKNHNNVVLYELIDMKHSYERTPEWFMISI